MFKVIFLCGLFVFTTMGLAQPSPKRVVIYFLIDNSNSMSGYQNSLKKVAQYFLKKLSQQQCLQYEIAVVYLSDSEKPDPILGVPRYVVESTPNAQAILETRLVPGISGFSEEKLVDPLINVVRVERNYLVGLAVGKAPVDLVASILLSDAGPSYDSQNATTSLEKIRALVPRDFMAFGWQVDFDRPKCEPDAQMCTNGSQDAEDYGPPALTIQTPEFRSKLDKCAARSGLSATNLFEDFAQLSGGAKMDICQDDFSRDMDFVVESIFERMGCPTLMM